MKNAEYTKRDLERSFKEGFEAGIQVMVVDSLPYLNDSMRLSRDSLAQLTKNEKVPRKNKYFNSVKRQAGKARAEIERAYKQRSKFQEKYSDSFLRDSGILSRVDKAIKTVERVHRELCEEIAYYEQESWRQK